MRADRVRGVGLSLREALSPERLRAVAARLDEHDRTSLWLPEFALRESFTQLGYLAGCTTRVRLATGVTPMASRTPVASALAAATLEDLSDGRAILGLGVSHASMTEGWHGHPQRSPLAWSREYLGIVRQVLDGEETDLAGSAVRSHGFTLLLGSRTRVPVVLAALGPKMLALGGRLADGVLVNWTTPAHAEVSVETVRDAAAAEGRPPPAVGAYVRVAAGRDAARQAQEHADFYTQLPAYRRSLLRMGFTDDDRMTARVASELILRGEPDEVADSLRAWIRAGVDPLVVYPIGDEAGIGPAIDLALDAVDILAADRR